MGQPKPNWTREKPYDMLNTQALALFSCSKSHLERKEVYGTSNICNYSLTMYVPTSEQDSQIMSEKLLISKT